MKFSKIKKLILARKRKYKVGFIMIKDFPLLLIFLPVTRVFYQLLALIYNPNCVRRIN